MNLILFTPAEASKPLPSHDPRAIHLINVLRRRAGDEFDAGLINGPRGRGTLVDVSESELTISFVWREQPPALSPVTLLVGMPRPQTARKILHEATAIGVSVIHFTHSDRGETSYMQSTLWSSGEWQRHLVSGAEQAFCTRLPAVTWARSLAEVIGTLGTNTDALSRYALDNYEATIPLGQSRLENTTGEHHVVLAVGSERGWSKAERCLLRDSGFTLAHLGPRVLRTETAVTAGLAIIHSKLGLM